MTLEVYIEVFKNYFFVSHKKKDNLLKWVY